MSICCILFSSLNIVKVNLLMKRFGLLTILMTAALFLSGCAGVENKEGKFYDFLVKPMEWLLHFFSGQFGW